MASYRIIGQPSLQVINDSPRSKDIRLQLKVGVHVDRQIINMMRGNRQGFTQIIGLDFTDQCLIPVADNQLGQLQQPVNLGVTSNSKVSSRASVGRQANGNIDSEADLDISLKLDADLDCTVREALEVARLNVGCVVGDALTKNYEDVFGGFDKI